MLGLDRSYAASLWVAPPKTADNPLCDQTPGNIRWVRAPDLVRTQEKFVYDSYEDGLREKRVIPSATGPVQGR